MARKPIPNRTSRIGNGMGLSATPVRNTAIPKSQSASNPKAVTQEMIAKRAYEISQSPQAGSEFENWVRAERELMGL